MLFALLLVILPPSKEQKGGALWLATCLSRHDLCEPPGLPDYPGIAALANRKQMAVTD